MTSIRTDDANHTIPSLATAAMRSIIAADKVTTGQPAGQPTYKGEGIDAARWGMVPQDIIWSTDRGNWMWDGVMVALRALGVDTSAPL